MEPRPLKFLLLKGFLFLTVGLILWLCLQPYYSRLLVAVSQDLVSWFQVKADEKTSIRLQEDMIIYIPAEMIAPENKTPVAAKRDVRDIHYNSVVLFALMLFSPGLSFAKRGWLLIAGLVLLFLTQVATVLVQAKFMYVYQLGEYSRMHYGVWDRNIWAFLKQFFELLGRFSFAFAIWILLTYKQTTTYLFGIPEVRADKSRKRVI